MLLLLQDPTQPPDRPTVRTSQGVVRCSDGPKGSKKLIVLVDQGIVDVAFALTPKYYKLQRQKYPAHISVIRYEWFNHPLWGKHEGETVEFTYDTFTYNDDTYHWMRAWSPRLREIRRELGLGPNRKITAAPDGVDCFHITIGNTKQSNQ